MKKTMKLAILSGALSLGLLSTFSAVPVANAATTAQDSTTSSVQYQLPHAVKIETGNFYYEIVKPIGFQTLEGISPLMLVNSDGIIRNSKVRVTMSDGSVLLQFKYGNADDSTYYVNADQVKLYTVKN